MGLFDFLSKKDATGVPKKHAENVANRRVQAIDRWQSIQALAKVGTPEAIEALLPRFDFYIDPSITDQEEKEAVFQAVVGLGDGAVAPVKRYLGRAESLSWAIKMLDRLLQAEQVRAVLLEQLAEMDTEYERDPQRKIQLLAELETRPGPDVLQAVVVFLDDVNETARFHAVGAVLAQEQRDTARESLVTALGAEESMRIKARLLDAFAEAGWSVDAAAVGVLPAAFSLDEAGVPRRS